MPAALANADRIVSRCLDAEVNFFDMADAYAGGQSEVILGHAIRSARVSRDGVILATKMGSQVGAGPNDGGLSPHHIMTQAKTSLTDRKVADLDQASTLLAGLQSHEDVVAAPRLHMMATDIPPLLHP